MRDLIARLTRRGNRQGAWMLPLLVVIGIVTWLSIGTDEFARPGNLSNLLAQAMPLLIASIGQMFVIVVAGLDLSVGSVISFSTAILALDAPGYLTFPALFMLAALIGATNGIAVTRLNVHPIIATLAMQYVVLGVTRLIRPVSGGTVPEFVIASVQGSFLGVPMPVFWAITVLAIGWKVLHASRFGLHLFAIGGGMASGQTSAARNFGVPETRIIISAYVASSLFAALAGVFLAGRIVSGDPNVGMLFELNSITAVALGGTQLSGGVGSLQGTAIGAFLLALLSNGMNLANVSPFIQTVVKGGLLLAVVSFQRRRKMGL
ncbi:ABC transporter permease [Oceanibium sediminis]|uniref:ABC transporter permease n=1 Tax=Oceanibium sediminis TaxID=2026339 RepID=UPI001E4D25FA|nr:ABC transporter permease [Oceanibium sediminis]